MAIGAAGAVFVLALTMILGAAALFTNGVEWLGKRLRISEGGVGSVLAAVGTALPETLIPIVAILWIGGPEETEVGIGAIIGAPFMLATLTLPLVGGWIVFRSRMKWREGVFLLNNEVARVDLGYFIPAFLSAVAATFIPVPAVRHLVAAGLILLYLFYLRRILSTGGVNDGELEPLYLTRLARPAGEPSLGFILTQIVLALAVMVSGAHLFVGSVATLALSIGLSPLVLSLLITPVATELPEKFNSLVWSAQRKDTLAVGNITGAMVFQGTIPVSIGLFFTPWELNHYSLMSASLAIGAGAVYYGALRWKGSWRPSFVASGALLYAVFVLYVVWK